VQTTAAVSGLQSITHDATLAGDGTAASPLKVAVPLILSGTLSITNSDTPNTIGAIVVNGFDADSGNGGDGVVIHGGKTFDNNNKKGGRGVIAYGGDGRTSGTGGVGVFGTGGDGPTPGAGVSAHGGSTFTAGGFVNGIGGAGIEAFGGDGVNGGGDGIVAGGGFRIQGVDRGRAGLFMGDVEVQGNFNVTGGGTKNFKIDHPLDPENRYLYHAAIESSEVLNIYSGNVTTDENGEATVTLPDWFEAVNRDFRYQLTVVGTFAQAIVGNKIKGNRFTIKTNAAGVEVSWQVTGIRSDAAMRKHPFKVEEEKPQSERGSYLAPDAYDQPEEQSAEWARHPQLMQQRKHQRLEAQPQRKSQ
jgi:hypothetical protein